MGGRTKPIGAVERAFEIVAALDELGPAGASAVARELDLSKSTAYTHLHTLDEAGYAVKEDGKYRLSCRFLELGSNVQYGIELYRRGTDEVQSLAADTDERTNLVIEEDGMGTCVYTTDAKRSMDIHMGPGDKYHMHATGTGKAILAHLSDDRVDEIIAEHGLPRFTENTITTREGLDRTLARIREDGVSFDEEETIEGLRCIAAPIVVDGDPLGALSVSGPSQRFNDDEREVELIEAVREAANVVQLNFVFS
jgi:DNA-binding IclR family transcriptional regulator